MGAWDWQARAACASRLRFAHRGIQDGPHKRSDARENPALFGTILMPMELVNCLSVTLSLHRIFPRIRQTGGHPAGGCNRGLNGQQPGNRHRFDPRALFCNAGGRVLRDGLPCDLLQRRVKFIRETERPANVDFQPLGRRAVNRGERAIAV